MNFPSGTVLVYPISFDRHHFLRVRGYSAYGRLVLNNHSIALLLCLPELQSLES